MMMNAQMKKVFVVFDEVCMTRKQAEKLLKGWEHKEKINEYYAVGYDFSEIRGLYLTKSETDALEELNEMNS